MQVKLFLFACTLYMSLATATPLEKKGCVCYCENINYILVNSVGSSSCDFRNPCCKSTCIPKKGTTGKAGPAKSSC
ncbi:hypothetical protein NOF04DRAFT_1331431 [Fusarium oxysporum II5]|nr:hypothetical protein NOF04DRAFT_1331431 [Fusarium oxysporum II5]